MTDHRAAFHIFWGGAISASSTPQGPHIVFKNGGREWILDSLCSNLDSQLQGVSVVLQVWQGPGRRKVEPQRPCRP
eukprot:8176440-Lingulodinium_polyedra.AAC.1